MVRPMWFSTPALDIVDLPADRGHYSDGVHLVPRRIVLHATAGKDSRAWLSRTSNPPVSVHRLIRRDGRIYKIVADEHVAYHVGFATLFPYPGRGLTSANYTSLGIELENDNTSKEGYTAAQVASAVLQVVEWFGKFGYLPVVSHADLDSRKSDPHGFDWQGFYLLVARSVAGLVD